MNENCLKNKIIDYIAEEKSMYIICKKIINLLKQEQEQCSADIIEYFFKEMHFHLNAKVNEMGEEEWKLLYIW